MAFLPFPHPRHSTHKPSTPRKGEVRERGRKRTKSTHSKKEEEGSCNQLQAMASLLRLLLAASLLLAATLPSACAGGQHQVGLAGWMLIPGSTPLDLAGGNDEEFPLDSEGSRRVLAGTGSYISYAALRPGNIPCSIPGNSYYTNCRAGGAVNPYTRSCSTINRCRS